MAIDIRPVLFLSTAHMKPETARRLDDTDHVYWPFAGGPIDCGYMIHADEEPSEDCPEELRPVFRFARLHGCEYIRFDRDGDTVEDLPEWDW